MASGLSTAEFVGKCAEIGASQLPVLAMFLLVFSSMAEWVIGRHPSEATNNGTIGRDTIDLEGKLVNIRAAMRWTLIEQ